MKTSNQRKTEFLTELRELMKKHGAEIIIEGRSRGFYNEPYLGLTMDSIVTRNEVVADYVSEDIGTRLDKDSPL
jgi:hypothetical protein